MAKSGKKWSKNGNSSSFKATKARESFLTPETKIAFNCLQLVFTQTLILLYFYLKYHIKIKTNILSYIISKVLNQLTFRTSLDKIVIKTNFG